MNDRIPHPPRFDVEIVDTPPKVEKGSPPGRAGQQATPRPRDYLDGFLAGKPDEGEGPIDGETVEERIVAALRDIFDPEIPVNIYDLGLIYGIEVVDGHAIVTMTLTTPHCPVAESMPGEVEMRVMSVSGVATAEVNLVWTPPWDPQRMSDEAKLELGML